MDMMEKKFFWMEGKKMIYVFSVECRKKR